MTPLLKASDRRPSPLTEPVAADFPEIVGAEIAAATYGKRVTGDFYDALRVDERILFGLLDVAGSRKQNSALLSTAQNIFRASASELFSDFDVNEADAMTTLCLRLNRGLMEAAGGVHPCPAFIACYNERFGTLCYCNAGHTSGLLFDTTTVSPLPSTGLALGLFSHATADAPTVAMAKGAILLLVSRGVVEAECKQEKGTEFGLDRVETILMGEGGFAAGEISDHILKAAADFSCMPAEPQDMTALCLVRAQ